MPDYEENFDIEDYLFNLDKQEYFEKLLNNIGRPYESDNRKKRNNG